MKSFRDSEILPRVSQKIFIFFRCSFISYFWKPPRIVSKVALWKHLECSSRSFFRNSSCVPFSNLTKDFSTNLWFRSKIPGLIPGLDSCSNLFWKAFKISSEIYPEFSLNIPPDIFTTIPLLSFPMIFSLMPSWIPSVIPSENNLENFPWVPSKTYRDSLRNVSRDSFRNSSLIFTRNSWDFFKKSSRNSFFRNPSRNFWRNFLFLPKTLSEIKKKTH